MWKPVISISVLSREFILADAVTKASKGLGMVNFTTTPGVGTNRCFEPAVRNLALGSTENALTKFMNSNLVCLDLH